MAQEACTCTKAEGEAEGTSKSMTSKSPHKIVTETIDEEISTLKKKIHTLQKSNWILREEKDTLYNQLDKVCW